ncbi:MAG TPA: nucleoside 2-deoxyribosyltransferase, partial [Candidatus Latescibacteria bacterium]|nr:nucleoside 2-deoxyribosyltransferase [Candidatus Latescibacterota bacterium]
MGVKKLKTIYLASPYGFSSQQKEVLLPSFVTTLQQIGLEVWEPFVRNNQIDFSEAGWAYNVGQADLKDVVESDAIFAIVN